MKIFLLLVIVTSSFITDAQKQHKKYSGEFRNGTANYTYFIDPTSGDEIRDGLFVYTEKIANNGSVYATLFKGNYKDGFKDGIWTYTISTTDIPVENNYYQTESTLMVQSFKEGMPNGKWTYTQKVKYRGKYYFKNGWKWKPYEVDKPINVSVNFNRGIVSGPFNLDNEITYATGNFNQKGMMDGKWLIISKNFTTTNINFNNGIAISYSIKNSHSGKIVHKSNSDIELKIQEKLPLLSKEDALSLIRSGITIDTMPSSNLFLFDEYFKKVEFMHSDIFGDKTYLELNDTKDYGRYILIERR